ncbi:hypothetical protein DP107_13845 [Haloglomus irregulare]|uniref:Uncharacterized protein n=1 Tax=Haloglomus irregulare TaxID=2234134 RepID=A0A554MX88_9EURY|nr:hypothetical protein DP107_13845 [Haloglomus irregulare]
MSISGPVRCYCPRRDDALPMLLAVGDGLGPAQGAIEDSAGPVAVFTRGEPSWERRDSTERPDGDNRETFGFSLAIDNDRALVGASDGGAPPTTSDGFDTPGNPGGGLSSAYAYRF